MGSPAAAGGACVTAAVREQQFLQDLPMNVIREIELYVLLMRWMDDLLQIWNRRKLSRSTKRALRKMASPNFYGGELEQISEGRAADTAFGFKLRTAGGVVAARSARSFAHEKAGEDPSAALPEWPHVHGGTGYGGEKLKKATASGRLLRELDMTNAPESEVVDGLMRVTGELVAAGFPRKMLQSVVARVESVSWTKLGKLKTLLCWDDSKVSSFCSDYDAAARSVQARDRLARAQEAVEK